MREADGLRVGVIGCGRLAREIHIPNLAGLPGTRIVALADPDPASLRAASARAPEAARLAHPAELLARPDLDAVLVCAPNALHAELAVAALERGLHLYLEKPLATTLADGRRVLDARRRAGTVAMIGFNYRFNPLFRAARAAVAAGRLGEVVGARSVFAAAGQVEPGWRAAEGAGGGVLLELASHHADLVRFVFGREVRAVSAELRDRASPGDSAFLTLRLADGPVIQMFVSLAAVEEDRLEIYGRAGKLSVDRYRSLDVEIGGPYQAGARVRQAAHLIRSLRHAPHLLRKRRAPGHEPSYRTALATFVAAARGGRAATPDLEDGYRSLEVVLAAAEAARSGRTVELAPAAGAPG